MNDENMRVRVTKRMLREGLMRCLKHTNIDKLSVTELCRESGVNRATFYNHYEIPRDILYEIAQEVADEMKHVFEADPKAAMKDRITRCLAILYNNKEAIRLVNASGSDASISKVAQDIFSWLWNQVEDIIKRLELKDDTEYELFATVFGMGSYSLIKKWLTEDIDKTPEEIAEIVMKISERLFGPI